MTLIFCGTPQFAVPTLERLIAEKHDIELVMTNPDEPRGRGYEVKPSPVKLAALKAGSCQSSGPISWWLLPTGISSRDG
jgi:methionyl-tRNA formyltransferase